MSLFPFSYENKTLLSYTYYYYYYYLVVPHNGNKFYSIQFNTNIRLFSLLLNIFIFMLQADVRKSMKYCVTGLVWYLEQNKSQVFGIFPPWLWCAERLRPDVRWLQLQKVGFADHLVRKLEGNCHWLSECFINQGGRTCAGVNHHVLEPGRRSRYLLKQTALRLRWKPFSRSQ